jgi:hypothetical protein
MSRRRITLLAIAAASTIVVAGLAASLAGAFSGNGENPGASQSPSTATPSQVAALAAPAYAAFNRARTGSDAIPAATVLALQSAQRDTGMDADLSRQVVADSNQTIWLVPGSGVLCTVVAQPGTAQDVSTTCVFSASANETGIVTITNGTTVSGVLPNGVSSAHVTAKDGSSQSQTSGSGLTGSCV